MGALANKLLKERMAPDRYYEVCHMLGLWQNILLPIAFSLVVDDFGVKYVRKDHTDHISSTRYQKIGRGNYIAASS